MDWYRNCEEFQVNNITELLWQQNIQNKIWFDNLTYSGMEVILLIYCSPQASQEHTIQL